ncbi:MAG: glycoside hydrolase family 3 N-terminal domain-containing protein [Actinomycetota bacterium]
MVAGVLTLVVALALAATPGGAQAQSASTGKPAHAERDRPGPPLDAKKGFLRSTLARMTLEEKVGQLFATWAYGKHANDATFASTNQASYGVDTPGDVVRKFHLGGILYFTWSENIDNPLQINGLSNSLQEIAVDQPSGIPLFLTIDQETGIVNRMNAPATEFPGNMAAGATRSEALTERTWTIVGKELGAVGVNMNFAPVLDVNTNPVNPVIGLRSFGENPDLVGGLGRVAVTAMQETGVSATIKHFPGHGDTDVDSHFGLPLVAYDRETLMNVHVAPFAKAIAAGVDAVMTAHMVVEAVDPDLPSTLSRKVLTGLLREELGFEGLVVTDALNMAALADFWTQDEIAVMALQAGADVLLMPEDLPLAYEGVLEAVRSRVISKKRIEDSVMRILETKYDRGLFHDPFADPDLVGPTVGNSDHLASAQQVARSSTTLVANDSGDLPLSVTDTPNALVVGPTAANTSVLAGRLNEQGLNATLQTVSTSPSAAQRANAAAAAQTADAAIVTTTNARGNSSQRQLVAQVAATGTPLIVVPAALPYDAAYVPGADAILVTYSSRPVAMRAAADVVLGVVQPTGLLPVSIPAADGRVLYAFGHGLSYSGP